MAEGEERADRAVGVEVVGMTKRFGGVTALEDVSTRIAAGAFHALLGENGAGKSTLVKCLVGYYQPDAGQIVVGAREQTIRSPHDAHALGIGMVYQHFTLVPSMTVAENLVMSRDDVPAVIPWRRERERLARFMETVPFELDLDRPVARLAAGEKQKVEILKQLYLARRFMILDEPTSVLTPAEADEVLGMLHAMTRQRAVTVLMITHKFREVMAFADAVTVLRRGRLAGEAPPRGHEPGAARGDDGGRARDPPGPRAPRPVRPPLSNRASSWMTWWSTTTAGSPPWRTSACPCDRARSSASRACPAMASASWWRR